jgi:hypothetical protein
MYLLRKNAQICLLLAASTAQATFRTSSPVERDVSNFDVFDYIDPFIGTIAGGEDKFVEGSSCKAMLNYAAGHVFPGATLPFGM